MENLYDVLQNKNNFFSFIRWTTGELTFWKDLVFNLDQAKKVIYQSKTDPNAQMWYNLKNT